VVKYLAKLLAGLKKVLQADIFKVVSLTALSTIVRMLTGLVSVKFVAVLIGPTGIALLGQLSNFSAIIMTIACGGINNGVTKYVSEFKSSEIKLKGLLSTAFIITLVCSLSTGVAMIIFSTSLSRLILLNELYSFVFVVFGLTIALYALNMLVASILNGFQEYRKFVSVSIAGSVLGLIFTLVSVKFYGLEGALISVVTFQSLMFFVSLWVARKSIWFNDSYFFNGFDFSLSKRYLKYSLMTFVTAATVPVGQLLLRGHVISQISSTEAGWWEAMNRISNMYLLVITTSFSVYYLPKLSGMSDREELRAEVQRAFRIILPTLIIAFILVYLGRFLLIKALFTVEFLPMQSLFLWQLLGDFLKIAGWILAYMMIAKAMTQEFIITEIAFSLLYVFLGFILIKYSGIIGLTQAYALNYLLYFVCMMIMFRKLLFKHKHN
jgi:PST family polysaccharide transporter